MGSSVGAFLETHVSEENAAQVAAGCLQGLCFDTNYLEVAGGRIWIVWDLALSVVVFQKSAQMVVCGIFDLDTQTSLTVGFVYAFNTEVQRRRLWDELKEISHHHLVRNNHFLILGDFNQILPASEHFSILPYDLPERGIDEFQVSLVQCDLKDLETQGIFLTWSNNRK